ncbi:MAG TPA: Uma2 family endonuclease [Tepidisphaeraceae bacterium]|nr:Uma2 family endonuclease [Tepidisphaeraceae bacterium]
MTQPVSVAASPSGKITYEEFLEWDGENQHVEWVNGRIVEMAPVGDVHQELGGWLITLLTLFVQTRKLGVIRYEPFQMKTGPDLPGRAPDVLFVAKRNLPRLKTNHLDGPADLVIEIISPGSAATDRGDKYSEYETGGVREYWLLDPRRKQAEFYQLGRDHLYHLIPLENGIFHSKVLKGLWLQVDWMWSKPIPPASVVWAKWQKEE